MSVESARAFCMRLMADEEFQASLGKAESVDAIKEIIKKDNYDFTRHDLLKIVGELTGKKMTSEELEHEVVGFYRDEVATGNPKAVENVIGWFRSI